MHNQSRDEYNVDIITHNISLRTSRIKMKNRFSVFIELHESPYYLFHHQIATSIENVKFRAVNVVLLPGTSSGQ